MKRGSCSRMQEPPFFVMGKHGAGSARQASDGCGGLSRYARLRGDADRYTARMPVLAEEADGIPPPEPHRQQCAAGVPQGCLPWFCPDTRFRRRGGRRGRGRTGRSSRYGNLRRPGFRAAALPQKKRQRILPLALRMWRRIVPVPWAHGDSGAAHRGLASMPSSGKARAGPAMPLYSAMWWMRGSSGKAPKR